MQINIQLHQVGKLIHNSNQNARCNYSKGIVLNLNAHTHTHTHTHTQNILMWHWIRYDCWADKYTKMVVF